VEKELVVIYKYGTGYVAIFVGTGGGLSNI
jgi:hypothetical protein